MSSFEEMIEDIKKAIEMKERAAAQTQAVPKPAAGALNETPKEA